MVSQPSHRRILICIVEWLNATAKYRNRLCVYARVSYLFARVGRPGTNAFVTRWHQLAGKAFGCCVVWFNAALIQAVPRLTISHMRVAQAERPSWFT